MLTFVFAPDSFKGSLTSVEVCELLTRAAKKHFPKAATRSVPIADGGEGTVDALLLATNGQRQTARVTAPMGDFVDAAFGILGDGKTAVIEMAQASGLPLAIPHGLDPMRATSFGTGELIRHVLGKGYRKLLIGIGGSATNDGGMGMLSALGARFEDANGNRLLGSGGELHRVARVNLGEMLPALGEAEITVMCDVNNPLLGPTGATYIYGPQKGARGDMLLELERGMAHYAAQLTGQTGRDIAAFPGAGAAGGMGAALSGVLNAAMRPGVSCVLDAAGFDECLAGASLVVTGEGKMDGQSILFGKAPAGVAERCARKGVPVVAIVGGMEAGAEGFYRLAESSIMTTISRAMRVEDAIADARALFGSAADRMFRLLKIGASLRAE